MSSSCALCGAEVTEWLLVAIQRERSCGQDDIEVLDCDDLAYLCPPCFASRSNVLREALAHTLPGS